MIAFINPFNNEHLYSYVSSLILNGIVREDDVVVYHDSDIFDRKKKDKFNGFVDFPNFKDISSLKREDFERFSKIHFLSLIPNNAPFVLDLLNVHPECRSKIYIVLTDDEVNRWRRVNQIFGKLIPSKRYRIDKGVIEVLQQVDNYIINKAFGEVLKNILKREIYCTNYTIFVPDKYLPMESVQEPESNNEHVTILFDSRLPSSFQYLRFLFSLFLHLLFNAERVRRKGKISLKVWKLPGGNLDSIIRFNENLIVKLCDQKKVDLTLIKVSHMAYQEYVHLLESTDFMIFRKRGGVGGALSFLNADGLLIIPKDSLNDQTFCEFIGKENFLSFSGYFHAISRILELCSDTRHEMVEAGKKEYSKYQMERNYFFKDFYSKNQS